MKLRASWLEPKGHSDRCVLVLHGIGDSRASSVDYFAPVFLTNGYAVLAPDSRAHGESGGSIVTYGVLERFDTLAWAKWLRAKGCMKVYGLGESLGASILLQAAAEEPAFSRDRGRKSIRGFAGGGRGSPEAHSVPLDGTIRGDVRKDICTSCSWTGFSGRLSNTYYRTRKDSDFVDPRNG